MKAFKELLIESLQKKIPRQKLDFLPSGFQLIGSIVMLNIRPELKRYEKAIGNVVLKNFGYVKTVCTRGRISGAKREPKIKIIAGRKNAITVAKENGCLFQMDVSKLMFAKGNIKERGRLPNVVGPKETIVDMFAGIGYFSVPIAKKNPLCRIYAIEINTVAVKYLNENCVLNRITNIDVIHGDCRRESGRLRNIADRVIMGYLPKTYNYLPFAFHMLKQRGIIHYHDIYREKELWKKPVDVLEKAAGKCGFRLKRVLYKGVVKSYAPGKFHIVVDAEFRRK